MNRRRNKEDRATEIRQIQEALLRPGNPLSELDSVGYKAVNDSSIRGAQIVEAPSGNCYAYYIESLYCDLPAISIVNGENGLPKVEAVALREVKRMEYVLA